MGKLIIENRTDMSDIDALQCVAIVMRDGRISNDGKQYCYATVFNETYAVRTDLNEKSDRFVIENA